MRAKLRVRSIFGGETAVPGPEGKELHWPVVEFVVPEPAGELEPLISEGKDGRQQILASVATTDRERTLRHFRSLAETGEEHEYEIDPPRQGRRAGRIRWYPRVVSSAPAKHQKPAGAGSRDRVAGDPSFPSPAPAPTYARAVAALWAGMTGQDLAAAEQVAAWIAGRSSAGERGGVEGEAAPPQTPRSATAGDAG